MIKEFRNYADCRISLIQTALVARHNLCATLKSIQVTALFTASFYPDTFQHSKAIGAA